jgi:hypothetical protein
MSDLVAGVLRLNRRNHSQAMFAAKALDYRRRWPWLTIVEPEGPGIG